MNSGVQFFAHPDCLTQRWSIPSGADPNPIDLSEQDKESIRNIPADKLHWCDQPVEIMDDIWLTGPIPRNNDFEDVGGPFYIDEKRNQPDLIHDDMSLWIGGTAGIVICGCCHSGIKNTLDHIVSFSGESQINTLIGGFHLILAGQNRLTQTVSFVNETTIKEVYPSHCTGEPAVAVLLEQLNCRVRRGKAGLQLEI